MKKAIKYLAIILVNLLFLFLLLDLWIDSFELTFNPDVRFVEQLKIFGFSVLSLIGIRLLIIYFRRKQIFSVKKKIQLSFLFTLLISSYLYLDYTKKIVNNRYIYNTTRSQLIPKIKVLDLRSTKFTYSYNITHSEYQQIYKIMGLPALPDDASNIEFHHSNSGLFGHEFMNRITYVLPRGLDVNEFEFNEDDYLKRQKVELQNDSLRVEYEESWF